MLVRVKIESMSNTTRHHLHGFIRRNIEPGSGLLTDNNMTYRGLSE